MLENIHDNPLFSLPNSRSSQPRREGKTSDPRQVNNHFIVRIVFHEADESKYDDLYDKMMKAGFAKEIRSDDGNLYELPPAEYHGVSSEGVKEVKELASRIADSVHSDNTVFVTRIVSWAANGLAPSIE